MKILVTGAAGFIGFHLCSKLLSQDHEVVGLDNLNDYYDVNLKLGRLDVLGIAGNSTSSSIFSNFKFYKLDICDSENLNTLFSDQQFDYVVHLAAQAGVRYSIENPKAYIQSNIDGFINILEMCRKYKPKHLVFASSSSVYGLNSEMPFSSAHHTDHPVSLYAATKKSNEMMAHSYAHLFQIPCTGLRFFTVYGPWGRPDMAYFSFTNKIVNGDPIAVFNNGNLMRDFTYIDDIVAGISALMKIPATADPTFDTSNPNPSSSSAPFALYNIGNNKPVKLLEFINILEGAIGKEAVMEFKPMQAGDVYATYADISALSEKCGFVPETTIETGLHEFVAWYKKFYKID